MVEVRATGRPGSNTSGAMSPDPVTVNVPPDW